MENSKIVKYTIGFLGQLTQKFDKCFVMEGVETADQKDFIKSYQYQQMYIQGYFYEEYGRTLSISMEQMNAVS